jgi:hypothetical protein
MWKKSEILNIVLYGPLTLTDEGYLNPFTGTALEAPT